MPNARSIPHNPRNTRFTDHFSTRLLYARHLRPALRLVIFRERFCSPLRITLRLITQYNSGISHVTYVYLALPYESDAGGCAGRGWQSGRGSRPFVCTENASSRYTYAIRRKVNSSRSRSTRPLRLTRARRYRRGDRRDPDSRREVTREVIAAASFFFSSAHRSSTSNFQVSSMNYIT